MPANAGMSISRRQFVGTTAMALGGTLLRASSSQSARPRPTPAQLQWQRDELALFLHFGINTFTNREWGDGTESPSLFAPTMLDARQWARGAKAAGFRALILTAKHHDGFCLWPTRTTTHSVASSPWRAGGGDLVREFVLACRAEGLGAGLYLSPWDRNHSTYGDSDRYNDVYIAQLTELLTNYGSLVEVWFDGANGEGPNGRRQVYDWPRVWSTVRRLQPNAVMFSDAGPDVRWSGNEAGTAGDPNWSTVDPARVPAPGVSGPGVIDALQHGDRDGHVWRPAECDTSIRPGWFYHPVEDIRVKSPERLATLYTQSVGRNSKLLLNVPPTPAGLLHETDVRHLTGMHDQLARMFGEDLVAGQPVRTGRGGQADVIVDVPLPTPTVLRWIRLSEDISEGQAVARYTVLGEIAGVLTPLANGTTIGYAKIDAVTETRPVSRIVVRIEETTAPLRAVTVRAFGGDA
jgi:alpha-L-fucosidase